MVKRLRSKYKNKEAKKKAEEKRPAPKADGLRLGALSQQRQRGVNILHYRKGGKPRGGGAGKKRYRRGGKIQFLLSGEHFLAIKGLHVSWPEAFRKNRGTWDWKGGWTRKKEGRLHDRRHCCTLGYLALVMTIQDLTKKGGEGKDEGGRGWLTDLPGAGTKEVPAY